MSCSSAVAPIPTPFGEILIGLKGPRLFNSLIAGAGPTTHSFDLPQDPWLVGMPAAAQGVVRGANLLMVSLCNAENVVVLSHALWSGRLTDEKLDDPATNAIRALNVKIRDDSRVDMSLVPIGDGLMLARKRG